MYPSVCGPVYLFARHCRFMYIQIVPERVPSAMSYIPRGCIDLEMQTVTCIGRLVTGGYVFRVLDCCYHATNVRSQTIHTYIKIRITSYLSTYLSWQVGKPLLHLPKQKQSRRPRKEYAFDYPWSLPQSPAHSISHAVVVHIMTEPNPPCQMKLSTHCAASLQQYRLQHLPVLQRAPP